MPKPRFDPAVTSLLDEHAHPLRAQIDALRTIVLATDASIEEGVKWNTASFKTSEWFATLNGPKQTKEAMVVLHAGAKAKGTVLQDRVADPTGMVRWLGKDRGLVVFANLAEIVARKVALQKLLRAWIALL